MTSLPTASLGNVMSRLPVRKGGPFRVGLCDRAVTDLKPGPASGLSPRRWPAGLAGRFALGLDAEEILLPLSGKEPWERQGAPYIRARAHVRMPAGFALGLDAAEPHGPRGPRGGEWANEREREREREASVRYPRGRTAWPPPPRGGHRGRVTRLQYAAGAAKRAQLAAAKSRAA